MGDFFLALVLLSVVPLICVLVKIIEEYHAEMSWRSFSKKVETLTGHPFTEVKEE